MSRAILIDTETNNMTDKEPIEVAWAEFTIEDDGKKVVAGKRTVKRFRPMVPISPGAACVHGIVDSDVDGEVPSSLAIDFVPEVDYWIAQNADFDHSVMGSPPVKRICTLALARDIWPELGSYKQAAIMYALEGVTSETRDRIGDAHSADADVGVLAWLANEIVIQTGATSIEALWELSEAARVPKRMPFGKFRGELISSLNSGYKRWLLGLDDLDEYLRRALEN